jgi:sugar phosphate isomerase/epimerase
MITLQNVSRRRFLAWSAAAAASSTLAGGTAAAAEQSLPYYQDRGWLIGCWTRPWAQHDYRVGFDAIAEAGFKHVSLAGAKTRTGRVIGVQATIEEAAQVGEEARQRGLAINMVYGGEVPLDTGPESLRHMIDNCRAAGAWSLMLANIGNEKTYETCCRTIAATCDYAVEKGVAIALKPHGGTTAAGPQLRDAVRRVNHKAFSVMYDPGNIFYYSNGQIDPLEDCEAILGHVSGLSIKDYDRKNPKFVMIPPGTGEVDFPRLIKKLRGGGFTHGPLTVETFNYGDDLAQTRAEAKKAKAFVERLVAS